ncbi:MAG TPA: hypothetical protein VGX48_02970 [Pyrinomonadaceae bacterium]|jgi:hypothetical protein|nr:hypothetical protein [Pyrinomonadaceae bacterium]
MSGDVPRRTLRELIARHGTGLCSDARRCEGLLRDLCGEHRREINILMGALEERVPLDLLAGKGSMPLGLLLSRLSKRLEEQLALTTEAARWAVDSWALALGVVTDAELSEREQAEAEERKEEERQKAEERRKAEEARKPQAPPPPKPTAPPPPRPKPTAPVPPLQQQRRQASPPVLRKPTAPAPPVVMAPPQLQRQDPRRGGSKWRGCLMGCVLIVVLALALTFAVPYVVSVLQEEQQGVGPPPVRTQ